MAVDFVAHLVVGFLRFYGFVGCSVVGIVRSLGSRIILGGGNSGIGFDFPDFGDRIGCKTLPLGLEGFCTDKLGGIDLHCASECVGASENHLETCSGSIGKQNHGALLVFTDKALPASGGFEREAFYIGESLVGIVENGRPDMVGAELLYAQYIIVVVVGGVEGS